MARMEGTLTRFFNKIADTDLLIIDDFGVRSLDKQQMLDFLELIEDRHAMKSTIIVSQLPVANWYDMMKSNSTAADAIAAHGKFTKLFVTLEEFAELLYIKPMQGIEKFWGYDLETVLASRW
ncbi:MAG: ATP-binding protein [Prevotella sp.]|nr:ATP-binding protein [Prevotella sp.]MBR2229450.1 ATP-binding protein [Prevotella sp.]MBR4521666.1 ATP-binding protein [Prevotella sp.]